MNITEVNDDHAFVNLIYWKSRQKSSAHNAQAGHVEDRDNALSISIIAMSLLLMIISISCLLQKYADKSIGVPISDLLAIPSAAVLTISIFQYKLSDGASAIVHRLASAEYDALVQEIERMADEPPNDDASRAVGERYNQLRRQTVRVPDKTWKKAHARYLKHIRDARSKLGKAET